MIKIDYVFLISLLLLAVFIWLRDTAWISTADDTLPILVALPLFVWLGAPWKFSNDPPQFNFITIILGSLLILLGIAFALTFLLTLGWTLILWTWLSARLVPGSQPQLKKLLVLPMLAFPWISLDIDRLGWWFRLTGSWLTGGLFSNLGYEVSQEGTNLLINQLPISVEKACAGLNTLQSMLIAGVMLDYIILGQSMLYWINLPVLILIAWMANTARIITITAAALYISPAFAMGAFHTIGGWLIILFMFFLSWAVLSLQERPSPEE